jgi:hypothetical protein
VSTDEKFDIKKHAQPAPNDLDHRTEEELEVVPDVSMKTFTKMLDEAWPKGMPPEKLEVNIVGPDQVVHTIDKVTLEIFDDQESIVIHWNDEEDVKQTP